MTVNVILRPNYMGKIINKENCFDNQSLYGKAGTGIPCLKGRHVPGKKLRGVPVVESCHFCTLLSS